MKAAVLLALLAAVSGGCAGATRTRVGIVKDVKDLPPGYGIMLATFQYVPGVSAFSRSQMLDDAYYVAERLSAAGYQSFTAPRDENCISVGIRASSFALANSLKKSIDVKGVMDLGDGNTLQVPGTELINLAELKISSPSRSR